jgi:hypothetical protein
VSERARAVADFSRNARPISTGTGGRNEPERPADLKRNQWPNWAGIRNFLRYRTDRRPLGVVFTLVFKDHPDGPFPDLNWISL